MQNVHSTWHEILAITFLRCFYEILVGQIKNE